MGPVCNIPNSFRVQGNSFSWQGYNSVCLHCLLLPTPKVEQVSLRRERLGSNASRSRNQEWDLVGDHQMALLSLNPPVRMIFGALFPNSQHVEGTGGWRRCGRRERWTKERVMGREREEEEEEETEIERNRQKGRELERGEGTGLGG